MCVPRCLGKTEQNFTIFEFDRSLPGVDTAALTNRDLTMKAPLSMLLVVMIAALAPLVQASEEVDEQRITTPAEALDALKAGNQRFLAGKPLKQDFSAQIEKTASGQQPYAGVLSCLDSRIPPEIIFDQGIGDIFVGRVAGNIEDINMIGSFEFASALVGTKLLVVMGHTSCGAVKGACADAKLGNLTALLGDIRPSVDLIQEQHPEADVCAEPLVDEIAVDNVKRTIADIRDQSPVLVELEEKGTLKIVGAMYDVTSGEVTFLEG